VADPRTVHVALAVLTEAYPNAKLTDERVRLYDGLLSDLGNDALMWAVQACVCESTYFPTIAEIRDAAFTHNHPNIAPAAQAWGDVARSIETGKPSWTCSLTDEAVQAIGGWSLIRQSSQGDLISHRARFIEAHASILKEAKRPKALSLKDAPAILGWQDGKTGKDQQPAGD